MERGKIERKEQKELERLKGIGRDQYKEKKNAYRKKVCELFNIFVSKSRQRNGKFHGWKSGERNIITAQRWIFRYREYD